MNLNLENKKILVIGASKGIGRSTCIELSKESAKIVAIARNKELLCSLKSECIQNGAKSFDFAEIDVVNGESKKIAEDLIEKYGSFDIVIHCVGTSLTSRNLISDKSDWIDCLNINALHAIEMNSVFIKDMIKNNIHGHILHISSISSINLRGNPLYASSKLFLNGYITTAGREFAKNGITINGVMPGAVSFEGSYWDSLEKQGDKKVDDFLKNHQAIHRFGTPEEVADLICFLVSDKARFTCGCVMPIDGGAM